MVQNMACGHRHEGRPWCARLCQCACFLLLLLGILSSFSCFCPASVDLVRFSWFASAQTLWPNNTMRRGASYAALGCGWGDSATGQHEHHVAKRGQRAEERVDDLLQLRDALDDAQRPQRAQHTEAAHPANILRLDAEAQDGGRHDGAVEHVPGVTHVGVARIEDEAEADDLDAHLEAEDDGENVVQEAEHIEHLLVLARLLHREAHGADEDAGEDAAVEELVLADALRQEADLAALAQEEQRLHEE